MSKVLLWMLTLVSFFTTSSKPVLAACTPWTVKCVNNVNGQSFTEADCSTQAMFGNNFSKWQTEACSTRGGIAGVCMCDGWATCGTIADNTNTNPKDPAKYCHKFRCDNGSWTDIGAATNPVCTQQPLAPTKTPACTCDGWAACGDSHDNLDPSTPAKYCRKFLCDNGTWRDIGPGTHPLCAVPPPSPSSSTQGPTCMPPVIYPSSTGAAPFTSTIQPQGSRNDTPGISGYDFDFTSDGVWDVTNSLSAQNHTYTQAGNYKVSIRTRSTTGQYSQTCSSNITVLTQTGTNTTRKDCSYAKDGGYACLSSSECVKCDNGSTLRGQDSNNCANLPCAPTPIPGSNPNPNSNPINPPNSSPKTPDQPTSPGLPAGQTTCKIVGNTRCVDDSNSEMYMGSANGKDYGWVKIACHNGCDVQTGGCKSSSVCTLGDHKCSDDGKNAMTCTQAGWQTTFCSKNSDGSDDWGCNSSGFCCDPKNYDCTAANRKPNSGECSEGATRCSDEFHVQVCANGKWTAQAVSLNCQYGCILNGSGARCADPTCDSNISKTSNPDVYPFQGQPVSDANQHWYRWKPGETKCPPTIGSRCEYASQACIGGHANEIPGQDNRDGILLGAEDGYVCCSTGCQEKTSSNLGLDKTNLVTCTQLSQTDSSYIGHPFCDKWHRNDNGGEDTSVADCLDKPEGPGCVDDAHTMTGEQCCNKPDIPNPPQPNPPPAIIPNTCTCNLTKDDGTKVTVKDYGTVCLNHTTLGTCECHNQVVGTGSPRIINCQQGEHLTTIPDGFCADTGAYTDNAACLDPHGTSPFPKQLSPHSVKNQAPNPVESAIKTNVQPATSCQSDGTLAIGLAGSPQQIIPRQPGTYCAYDPAKQVSTYLPNQNLCDSHALGDHWIQNNQCFTCAEVPHYSGPGKNVSINEPKYKIGLPGGTLSPAYCKADSRYSALKWVMGTLSGFKECVDGICPSKI